MRLIDADALKAIRFVSTKHKEPEVEAYMRGWNDAVDSIIENAPTIEAEPIKHGQWIESWGGIWHSCSVCGGIPPFNMRGDDIPTPYCPHCGAKMDLDEVENG